MLIDCRGNGTCPEWVPDVPQAIYNTVIVNSWLRASCSITALRKWATRELDHIFESMAGKNALVFCRQGCHRSAFFLLLVLMAATGVDVGEAERYLKALRPVIDVNARAVRGHNSGKGQASRMRTALMNIGEELRRENAGTGLPRVISRLDTQRIVQEILSRAGHVAAIVQQASGRVNRGRGDKGGHTRRGSARRRTGTASNV